MGKTTRDPVVRCAEINKSSTGDFFLWEVMHSLTVNDCHKCESLVHAKLVPLRQRGREFFNIHPNDAIVAIRSILESAADLRVVTIAEDQKRDHVVLPRNSCPPKQSSRRGRDTHMLIFWMDSRSC
ncbi:GIY-YIG nuclease family protein [Caballeronia calidae]|uniref:GIY-YIG nuclease family protein n=1 Tax=Caballeronia calidae TaxID=1777139 RepID=UPI0009ED6E9C